MSSLWQRRNAKISATVIYQSNKQQTGSFLPKKPLKNVNSNLIWTVLVSGLYLTKGLKISIVLLLRGLARAQQKQGVSSPPGCSEISSYWRFKCWDKMFWLTVNYAQMHLNARPPEGHSVLHILLLLRGLMLCVLVCIVNIIKLPLILKWFAVIKHSKAWNIKRDKEMWVYGKWRYVDTGESFHCFKIPLWHDMTTPWRLTWFPLPLLPLLLLFAGRKLMVQPRFVIFSEVDGVKRGHVSYMQYSIWSTYNLFNKTFDTVVLLSFYHVDKNQTESYTINTKVLLSGLV